MNATNHLSTLGKTDLSLGMIGPLNRILGPIRCRFECDGYGIYRNGAKFTYTQQLLDSYLQLPVNKEDKEESSECERWMIDTNSCM